MPLLAQLSQTALQRCAEMIHVMQENGEMVCAVEVHCGVKMQLCSKMLIHCYGYTTYNRRQGIRWSRFSAKYLLQIPKMPRTSSKPARNIRITVPSQGTLASAELNCLPCGVFVEGCSILPVDIVAEARTTAKFTTSICLHLSLPGFSIHVMHAHFVRSQDPCCQQIK